MESSVGWTISDDGAWTGGVGGSSSVVSFGNSVDGPGRGGDGEGEATVQAAAHASIVRSLHSISTAAPESKSIFELSRRYVRLALCSSGQTVVPVRLGRALAEATVSPKTSSAIQNGSHTRPAPPPRDVTGDTQNDGIARRTSPRASAGGAMIPHVGRRRYFAPTSPACGAAAGSGVGGATDGCVEWDGSSSKWPTENDRQKLDKGSTAGSKLRLSPSPTRASVNGISLETTKSNDQDVGESCCSRSRRCGASPTRERSASLERLGGGTEIGALLAKYHRIENYDCPVSPFSMPPSWADIPPLSTLEPPGFPPPHQILTDPSTVIEEVGRECQLGGVDLCMSRPLEDGTTQTLVPRPVEKTVFQKIASGRRVSFGWGWKRPSGDRGRARKRKELSASVNFGANLRSVFPPTS